MAIHALTANFNYFFARLNPSPTFVQQAAREHASIRALIEHPNGPAGILSPECFLQGSYKQDTAIDTINDVDIVVMCKLWQPGSASGGGRSFDRNEIFDIIASPLKADRRYRNKVRYNSGSMCIKVDLGIKIEILPVVYRQGNYDIHDEPFRLYRPETKQWEDGYARLHQSMLTLKNSAARTNGNFKPAIKVFKHLRSLCNIDAVSFHIESLLYALPDNLFLGSPAEYITNILNYITNWSANNWYQTSIKTPCNDRILFSTTEWNFNSWNSFYELAKLWARGANLASNSPDNNDAIEIWKIILGDNYFPANVTR
ncbi:MAG TPA: hypothetical protein PK733_19725 [Clostridiales bacterium]|nr:hypothetical protein [Clostridiales bacterium]